MMPCRKISASRSARALTIAAFVLAAWVAFTFSFTPLRTSHDEFWHLKSGQWVAAHGLPENDIFTYTAESIPWHNHEWLTQIAMWKLWQAGEALGLGGWRAVILFKSLCIVAAFAGLGWGVGRSRRERHGQSPLLHAGNSTSLPPQDGNQVGSHVENPVGSSNFSLHIQSEATDHLNHWPERAGLREPVWAALAAALGAALARRTFYPRPPFISYLLLAVVLWVFIEWRAGRRSNRTLWWLVPLFVIWANLHGGWMTGLVVVAAFWGEGVLRLLGAWYRNRKAPPLITQSSSAGQFDALPLKDAQPTAAVPQSWQTPLRRDIHRLGYLTLVGAACGLATLVNPYGYHLYELAGRVSADQYLWSTIGELKPPDWHFVWILEGMILLAAALALRPVRLAGWLGTALILVSLHFALRAPFSFDLRTLVERSIAASLPKLSINGLLIEMTRNPHWLHAALALPIFAAAAWGCRRRLAGWPAHAVLAGFFGWQGIAHVRHLPWLGIVLLPLLAVGMEAWSRALQARWIKVRRLRIQRLGRSAKQPAEASVISASVPPASSLQSPALIVLALLAIYWTFADTNQSIWRPLTREAPSYFARNLMLARGVELQPAVIAFDPAKQPIPSKLPAGVFEIQPYPVAVCDFLLRARLPGRLWNGGNYAGYLIWRLAPEHTKVFTDNRYDIYGGRFIRQEHAVLSGWDEAWFDKMSRGNPAQAKALREQGFMTWREVLDRWEVQTVFIPTEAPGNARLAAAGWVRVYEDFNFNLWVRDIPANRPAINRALSLPRPAPWLRMDE